MIDLNRLTSKFEDAYRSKPRLFRAPGRINIIGEHTDHNEGFVLPCAIDFATYVAAGVRGDRKIRVGSLNFDRTFEFDLDGPPLEKETAWVKYVQGVALILERSGYRLRGADLLIDSDVPVGAGLSSSATLEISVAFALSRLSGYVVEGMELAKIGQTAEHEFAGVLSGIMDQFASVYGSVGNGLLLDCRSLEWSAVPLSDANFIVCNTKVKHDLADGEYNVRRRQCDEAAKFFEVSSLRDLSKGIFEDRSYEMPEVLRRRARHVISENHRVLDAVESLHAGDLKKVGELLTKSHASLRDDFEVSSKELDLMVEIASRQTGVFGARMMGGGFGGCTINLVEPKNASEFIENVTSEYRIATGIECDIYRPKTSSGASEI
ncbi:MAG: galactokinase [Acidobacteriota bacterium]